MMVLFGASLLGCNDFDDNTCEDQMSSASWGKTTALVKYVPRESVIEKALKEHDFNGIDTYYIPDPIWLKLAPFDKRCKFIDLFRSKTNSNFNFFDYQIIIEKRVDGGMLPLFSIKLVSPEKGWPLEYRRLVGNDDEQDVNNSGITPFISMMFPNIEDNFLSIIRVAFQEFQDIMVDSPLTKTEISITTDGTCEIVYSDGKKRLIPNFVDALGYLLIDDNSLKSSNPVKYNKPENDEKWCCPVCYSCIEELKEITEFNACKHAFCSKCYDRNQSVCPLCRVSENAYKDKIISLEEVRRLFDDSSFRSLINKEDSRKNFKESAHYSFFSKAIATCIEHGKEKDREKICNSSIYKGFRKMYSKHKSK